MTETIEKVVSENDLAELGFTAAACEMMAKRLMARKLRIAFEHFRVVTPEAISRFNTELLGNNPFDPWVARTLAQFTYQRLAFTDVAHYRGVPPKEVLDKVREAKALECFDGFEVATIESVTVVPDPVVFGVINGCPNKYFVAQWDNDLSIEQILKDDEG